MSYFTEDQKIQGFLKLQDYLERTHAREIYVARTSGIETEFVKLWKTSRDYIEAYNLNPLLHHAGIRINERQDAEDYADAYIRSFLRKDNIITAVWDGEIAPKADFFPLNSLRDTFPAHGLEFFYFFDHPEYRIDEIFKNLRILVITSHAVTVRDQLRNSSFDYLPISRMTKNCEFEVVKPPVQFAGESDGRSWKDHFEEFTDYLEAFEFDVAFVSCGGFAMPVIDFINRVMQRGAIYIGGPLQLFFGIMGKRWLANEKVSKLVNYQWVEPLQIDKPRFFDKVEGGCYW